MGSLQRRHARLARKGSARAALPAGITLAAIAGRGHLNESFAYVERWRAGRAPSGSAELYEDDGWSNRYVYDTGATAWTTLSWRAIGSGDDGALSAASVELRVSLGAARGCLHSQPSGVPAEPGQPAGCRAGGAESGEGATPQAGARGGCFCTASRHL